MKLAKWDVMGLHGKVLVAGGGYRGGFCQKLLAAFPMSDNPEPAGSKTDPLLAKAKQISNGDSASVIAYLRRGRKKTVVRWQWREKSETK